MKKTKFHSILILLVGIMLLATACSSASADSRVKVSKVKCVDIDAQIKVTKTDLSKAKANAKHSEGKPNESEVKAAVVKLKKQVKQLNKKRAKVCVSKPAGTKIKPAKKTDALTALPVIEGGDPLNPSVGSGNDPRTPDVRDGKIVTGWTGLDKLLGNDQSYVNCVNNVVPNFNWSRDVPNFRWTERQGNDSRYILAVRTLASDEQIRQMASQAVGEDVSHLKILPVDAIINTRGFKDGGCETFVDRRPMVRVTLGKVIFNPDGSIKGLANDGGVFVDCHNPWKLLPPAPAPNPSSPGPTPTPNPCPPAPAPRGVGCIKPESNQNQSRQSQPVGEHFQGPTPGAPATEPPPASRPQGHEWGGSGTGGAPPASGPTETGHGGETTTATNPPPCPFGPGNC